MLQYANLTNARTIDNITGRRIISIFVIRFNGRNVYDEIIKHII